MFQAAGGAARVFEILGGGGYYGGDEHWDVWVLVVVFVFVILFGGGSSDVGVGRRVGGWCFLILTPIVVVVDSGSGSVGDVGCPLLLGGAGGGCGAEVRVEDDGAVGRVLDHDAEGGAVGEARGGLVGG